MLIFVCLFIVGLLRWCLYLARSMSRPVQSPRRWCSLQSGVAVTSGLQLLSVGRCSAFSVLLRQNSALYRRLYRYIVVEKHDYSSSPAHSIAPRRHAARRWVPVTRRALTWIRETRSSAWTIPLSLGPELDAGGVKRYLAL